MTSASRLKHSAIPRFTAGTRLRAFRLLVPALLCLVGFAAAPGTAEAAQPDTHIEQNGELPKQGRAVIRSGMAWMDETAPTFQRIAGAFSQELASRGLVLVTVRPSALEPMPKTPLPNKQAAKTAPTVRPKQRDKGIAEGDAAQKAQELGKSGKLPPLKLRTYAAPDKDTDLPESVRSIAAPDVTRALYARSQQAGKPVVQSFAIPGRIPKELAEDARKADYAFVVRFAAVRTWAAAPDAAPCVASAFGWWDSLHLDQQLHAVVAHPVPGAFGPGVLVAASTIGGTGRLGFGAPTQGTPPGQSTYGTPSGYARGYEGPSGPGDFWHRDNDFYQRDYQFKNGPQPQYATPPTGLSGSVTGKGQRGFGAQTLPGRGHGPSVIGWHLLMLDCFDLAPVRAGNKPAPIWQAVIRSPGDTDDFNKSLPKMIRAIFAAK